MSRLLRGKLKIFYKLETGVQKIFFRMSNALDHQKFASWCQCSVKAPEIALLLLDVIFCGNILFLNWIFQVWLIHVHPEAQPKIWNRASSCNANLLILVRPDFGVIISVCRDLEYVVHFQVSYIKKFNAIQFSCQIVKKEFFNCKKF